MQRKYYTFTYILFCVISLLSRAFVNFLSVCFEFGPSVSRKKQRCAECVHLKKKKKKTKVERAEHKTKSSFTSLFFNTFSLCFSLFLSFLRMSARSLNLRSAFSTSLFTVFVVVIPAPELILIFYLLLRIMFCVHFFAYFVVFWRRKIVARQMFRLHCFCSTACNVTMLYVCVYFLYHVTSCLVFGYSSL